MSLVSAVECYRADELSAEWGSSSQCGSSPMSMREMGKE
jgi:hypothetical protein